MRVDKRRAQLVVAATELYEEKGIRNTSVGDITSRVGVTRSLFYHYFADKQAITDAVIDHRVDQFMAYVRDWTSKLNNQNVYDSLLGLAGVVRRYLLGPSSLGLRTMREEDAGLFQRFVIRSSTLIAKYFIQTRDERGSLIRMTNTRHPEESFYVLSVGIMSMMLRQSGVTDEVIADLIIDTLHIDLDMDPRQGDILRASHDE